jgi:DNA-binding CsgD family transcriptional regulator
VVIGDGVEHILVLLYTLALAAGAASTSVVHQLSRDRRQALFRDYVGFLLLLNLCVAFNLAATYLENALTRGFPLEDRSPVMILVDLAGMALVGGIVFKLVRVMYAAVDSAPPKAMGKILAAVLAVVAVAAIVAALLMPSSEVRDRIRVLPRTANLLLIAAAVLSAVPTLVAGRRLESRRRDVVRCFAGLHLVAFLAILVGFFVPTTVAWHLLAVGFLLVNVIPLTLLRGTRADRLARFDSVVDIPENLRAFAAKYGISARELEIVVQVLSGKTNPEMADALFISANTVKNHIHNIYRKCGVRNRVELIRLIHRA